MIAEIVELFGANLLDFNSPPNFNPGAAMTRAISVAVIVLAMSVEAQQAESPFNPQDPEIQLLKKLDWKGVDFNALDPRSRCEALLALTKLLDITGGKAAARADLLSAYLDENKLGEEYAADPTALNEKPPPITYEDAKKLAAAFIKTPQGKERFGDELADATEPLLKNYQVLYDKTCARKWAEVIESRTFVKSMADFVQRKGKWDDYLKWSKEEAERRQKQFETEQKTKQAAYVQAQEQKREAAVAEAQRRAQAEREARATQSLDYAMSSQSGDGGGYDDGSSDWGYGGSWGWGANAYYINSGYRNDARDRVEHRVQNWRARPAARGGGGRRR
jgi:hypothetical protein